MERKAKFLSDQTAIVMVHSEVVGLEVHCSLKGGVLKQTSTKPTKAETLVVWEVSEWTVKCTNKTDLICESSLGTFSSMISPRTIKLKLSWMIRQALDAIATVNQRIHVKCSHTQASEVEHAEHIVILHVNPAPEVNPTKVFPI